MYKPGWFHLAHPSPLETIYVQIQKVGNFRTKCKNTYWVYLIQREQHVPWWMSKEEILNRLRKHLYHQTNDYLPHCCWLLLVIAWNGWHCQIFQPKNETFQYKMRSFHMQLYFVNGKWRSGWFLSHAQICVRVVIQQVNCQISADLLWYNFKIIQFNHFVRIMWMVGICTV